MAALEKLTLVVIQVMNHDDDDDDVYPLSNIVGDREVPCELSQPLERREEGSIGNRSQSWSQKSE